MLAAAADSSSANHRQVDPGEADHHNNPKVLVILSLVIERLVARNDQLMTSPIMRRIEVANNGQVLGKNMKVFDGVRAPSISIPKYLERIYKYTKCSPSCFVVGYIYIDRLVHRHPHLLVVSLNVHRLLVTTLMVASKMLDDEHYDNAFYARVGGVSNAEMNRLELELLFLLDFDVVVKAPEFEIYCFYLEREMSRLSADEFTLAPAAILDKPSASLIVSALSAATITFVEDEEEEMYIELQSN